MHSKSPATAGIGDYFKALLQYPLPHHLLSRMVHRFTRLRLGALTTFVISRFINHFKVNMQEASNSDVGSYASFNAFFTRTLAEGARRVDPAENIIISPVDGAVSQLGEITGDRILQAKKRWFTTEELLGGDATLAAQYENGHFITLYLSPRDYHRIHMPYGGELKQMIHIPGRLFSVNPPTTRAIPRLFARNERVASIFSTQIGEMALVMVGALFVSSIETVWAGEITPPQGKAVQTWTYSSPDVSLKKGEEAGRFNMGSTVILLFRKNALRWLPEITPNAQVKMGQALGDTRV
ncbi:MAG: archaetidylserine decarboxylase [Gammaproteobacteria bacterium]|nr:archaetidylserine decarboxylase [Gammaproteobacteria bacterium]